MVTDRDKSRFKALAKEKKISAGMKPAANDKPEPSTDPKRVAAMSKMKRY